jgi:UDP-glucose/iron transport system permease protein
MASRLLSTPLALDAFQTAAATGLAFAVVLLARRQGVRVERESGVALARGLVQIVAVGAVLSLVLRAPLGAAALLLAAMVVFAARIAAGRVPGVPGAFPTALAAIGGGSGIVILFMVVLGVVRRDVTDIVSVGSMILANAMNTCALALERLRSDMEAHRGYIEAGLALGASPAQVTAPYVQNAVRASLIPRLDSLSSLGIVWIPGLMAGMVLTGAHPLDAALFQFVTLALVLAAAGLTSLVCVRFLRARAFTSAAQLAPIRASLSGDVPRSSSPAARW